MDHPPHPHPSALGYSPKSERGGRRGGLWEMIPKRCWRGKGHFLPRAPSTSLPRAWWAAAAGHQTRVLSSCRSAAASQLPRGVGVNPNASFYVWPCYLDEARFLCLKISV